MTAVVWEMSCGARERDMLRAEGFELKVGKIDRFTSVAKVIEHFRLTRD